MHLYNPQLETFVAVANAGSFSRAAKALYISPNAVIKQINLLEGSLGLPLFTRTHSGVALTPAGASLYRDATYMIQYARDAAARARDAACAHPQVVRVGSSPLTPADVLLDLWPAFHRLCPDIQFQLIPFENTPENAREILAHLGQGIDLVPGIFDEALLAYRHCDALPLAELPLCCAVPVTHPLAQRPALRPEDLCGQTLLLRRRGEMSRMDRLRDDLARLYPSIRLADFDFYNTEVFNRAVREGCLLLAVPNWKAVHPLLRLLPVQWPYTVPFGLLHAGEPAPLVQRCLGAVARLCEAPRTAPEA